jgi:hypothetical protein
MDRVFGRALQSLVCCFQLAFPCAFHSGITVDFQETHRGSVRSKARKIAFHT